MSRAKRSADYVTVACKYPQGLVIPVQGLQEPVRLHGSHSPFARHGYGMTEVKTEVWAEILRQYGAREGVDRQQQRVMIPQAAWLANHVVFAASEPQSAVSEAQEYKALRTGVEAINRDKINETPGLAGVKVERDGAPDAGDPSVY